MQHTIWLEYGGLVVCDAAGPPDIEELEGIEEQAGPYRAAADENHAQAHLHVVTHVDERRPGRRLIDVPSGRLFVGSTEWLVEPGAGEGKVLEVEPGRWAVRFLVTEDRMPFEDSEIPVVHVRLVRIGDVGARPEPQFAGSDRMVHLLHGALVACDVSQPPRPSLGFNAAQVRSSADRHQAATWEVGEPGFYEIEVAGRAGAPRGERVDVPSGRLFVGSTAMLDGSPLDDAEEGLVLDVEPGHYALALAVDPVNPGQTRLTMQRVGPVGIGDQDRKGVEVQQTWKKDMVEIRVPGSATERPAVLFALFDGAAELERAELTPLWFRDGAWVFQIWLLGIRSACDRVQVLH